MANEICIMQSMKTKTYPIEIELKDIGNKPEGYGASPERLQEWFDSIPQVIQAILLEAYGKDHIVVREARLRAILEVTGPEEVNMAGPPVRT